MQVEAQAVEAGSDDHAKPSAFPATSAGPRWLAIALGVTLVVRLSYLSASNFPLGDGGLFYVMTRDLQQAGFRLPAATTYNAAGIPFVYPPFGFYAAGLLSSLFHIDLVAIFRFLPVAINLATVVAFFWIAGSILGSRRAAIVAGFGFAFLPAEFVWSIMGGGLTRSLGQLFAILALWQLFVLYTRGPRSSAFWASIFCAFTVLSHPEATYFLGVSAIVLFAFYGRNRRAVLSSCFVVIGAFVVASPWLATVLALHGPRPFLAALASGGAGLSSPIGQLISFNVTAEPLFPVIAASALLGILACFKRRALLLPCWAALTILLDPREGHIFSALPVALLAGVGIDSVLLPYLDRLSALPARPRDDSSGAGAARTNQMRALDLSAWALLALGCYVFLSAMLVTPRDLGTVSPDQRAAMNWVAENTPPETAFLVIGGAGWASNSISEWFPALAQRKSVATPQGKEWTGGFAHFQTSFELLQSCSAYRGASCLDSWSRQSSTDFTAVYVARYGSTECCPSLRYALLHSTDYREVYDGAGATIFVRASEAAGTAAGQIGPSASVDVLTNEETVAWRVRSREASY